MVLSARECLVNAERCEDRAGRNADEANQRMLLEVAAQWRKLASVARARDTNPPSPERWMKSDDV